MNGGATGTRRRDRSCSRIGEIATNAVELNKKGKPKAKNQRNLRRTMVQACWRCLPDQRVERLVEMKPDEMMDVQGWR